ncbi:MAG: type II toxin-antitoxin system HicA family toxin [Candidatus Paceibacterota bacterium]|jgi:predicted RNA binding protein YcfA (HicA-like mRNA interferase family)
MPKLPVIKVRELVKILDRLGFLKHHCIGSHAQFKRIDGYRITIPIHHGKDFDKGILRGIIGDLNLTVDEFIVLLKKKK